MSSWDAVRHDAAAAADAASRLRSLADELDQLLGRRRQLADDALQGWSGAHRDDVAPEIERQLRVSGQLAAELRAAATRIDAATQAAAEEQRRRVRVREQHAAELRRAQRLGGPR